MGAPAQLSQWPAGQPPLQPRWFRLGKVLPWVVTQQVFAYWLRHTALTWVERVFGYGVAPVSL